MGKDTPFTACPALSVVPPSGVEVPDMATFEELLDDFAGATAETAVFNVTQRSMTVRMTRPRREKVLQFVEKLLFAPAVAQEAGLTDGHREIACFKWACDWKKEHGEGRVRPSSSLQQAFRDGFDVAMARAKLPLTEAAEHLIKQEPLGEPFASVLNANLNDLYSTEAAPAASAGLSDLLTARILNCGTCGGCANAELIDDLRAALIARSSSPVAVPVRSSLNAPSARDGEDK